MKIGALILLFLFVFSYLIIGLNLIKRKLGIETKRRPFLEGRKKIYVGLDILNFFIGMFSFLLVIQFSPGNVFLSSICFFIIPTLSSVLRGVEEWIEYREERRYYVEYFSVSASVLFVIIFYIFVREGFI
ncbi:DUF4181 domain-containing protein [Radiobacillus kanasensis]|uniref:DUF4181 domain-containing protein n=1 Tax=Radiobacillus kanasensis TaxID=2844358 RepID=UPI0038B53632